MMRENMAPKIHIGTMTYHDTVETKQRYTRIMQGKGNMVAYNLEYFFISHGGRVNVLIITKGKSMT